MMFSPNVCFHVFLRVYELMLGRRTERNYMEEEFHQLALMQGLRSICNHPRLVYPNLDPQSDDIELDELEEASWDGDEEGRTKPNADGATAFLPAM